MNFKFEGTIFEWRGPAPFYFVRVPQNYSDEIKAVSSLITYGWGVIPATAKVGETEFKTALFPKDGKYLVPLKVALRKAENLDEGDVIKVELRVDVKF